MKKILLLAVLAVLTLSPAAIAKTKPSMLSAAPAAPPSSEANSAERTQIAAVVNDSIITTTDLVRRIRLAILSSGLPDTVETRTHLIPQILRGLIDEQLEMQEAKRLDLNVTPQEVDQAMVRIAHDNHIPVDMKEYVASHGGSPEALVDQIRAGLLWNKVIQHELRPRVEVGDDEIDAVIARVRADTGKQEFLVSEIFLSVDNSKDEDQVHQVADNLVSQIKSGANFGAVARQFSQGVGAASGGDIGWIQQGQLAPELNKVLATAVAGEVTDPIRTANGFHILGIREVRTVSLGNNDKASINVMQIFHPYGANKQAVLAEGGHVRSAIKSCGSLEGDLAAFPGWKSSKAIDMQVSHMPAPIATKLAEVPVGGASEVLPTDKGAVVMVVCGRNDGGDVDRDAIMHSIGTDKLELQARRLLRDLRRAAYLDVRLGE